MNKTRQAFTLVELLVVVGIISLLAALLLPAIVTARDSGLRSRCSSNLRQLHLANELHAQDHECYVPAAGDVWGRNSQRWHGVRTSTSEPFDGSNGPLAKYLGRDHRIRKCPALRGASSEGFEAGCGGYGYNSRGVGSEAYFVGSYRGSSRGVAPDQIASPSATVMFTDTAFPRSKNGSNVLIEYSFAEAYRHIGSTLVRETYEADPSIHFRHRGKANVVWCDGHVSAETMTFSKSGGAYNRWNIGWFGERNNELFDPF